MGAFKNSRKQETMTSFSKSGAIPIEPDAELDETVTEEEDVVQEDIKYADEAELTIETTPKEEPVRTIHTSTAVGFANDPELSKLMITSPEALAREQHDKLKAHTLNVLTSLVKFIDDEDYESATTMLSQTNDSYNINFGYDDQTVGLSIDKVIARLATLGDIAK